MYRLNKENICTEHTLFRRGSTHIAITIIILPKTVMIVNAAKPMRRAIILFFSSTVTHLQNKIRKNVF